MQGYIIHTQKVKDEDMIVYLLTSNSLIKCYRFYGARHPSIMQGYKIDFELVESANFLPHLRSVLHLGFSWLILRERLIIWQQFMRLFYTHLKDVEHIDEIYFQEVELCAQRLLKQNPKRLIIEAYVRILEHEGRLHDELTCFVCDEKIESHLSLARGFLPSHSNCFGNLNLKFEKIQHLFKKKSTILLDDREINELYSIVLQGF
ncbi:MULTISPECIES: recombination protein RecO [unclassified Campylobacter]|uniref:recombination protein RecO n=1 Tax=unclassified Campylobacter TaxID=2593542 RepID=UPI001472973C|nr:MULTISPECIES: recombination protein RecO [unclassified Campylobacter]